MTIPSEIPTAEEKDMSLREKSAWACFLSTLIIYLPYFAYVLRLLGDGGFTFGRVFSAMLTAVVVQTVLVVGATVLFARRCRQEPKDERDIALERRACRSAYFVLAAGCFSVVMGAPGFSLGLAEMQRPGWFMPLLMSQGLLFCFVVAETTRYGTLALGYRRGI